MLEKAGETGGYWQPAGNHDSSGWAKGKRGSGVKQGNRKVRPGMAFRLSAVTEKQAGRREVGREGVTEKMQCGEETVGE